MANITEEEAAAVLSDAEFTLECACVALEKAETEYHKVEEEHDSAAEEADANNETLTADAEFAEDDDAYQNVADFAHLLNQNTECARVARWDAGNRLMKAQTAKRRATIAVTEARINLDDIRKR